MNNLKKFFSYYKPYKTIFIFDLISAIALSLIALWFPLLIREATKQLELGNLSIIMPTVIKMTGLVVFYTLSAFFLSYQGHMMGAHIENDMRKELFDHYQNLSLDFYDNHKVGALMSRLTGDLYNIGELAHHGPEDMLMSTISFVGSLIIMMKINAKLALIALILVPIMVIYAVITGLKMSKEYARNREIMSDMNASIEESLSGIRVVKSYTNEAYEKEQFNKLGNEFIAGKKKFYLSEILFYEGLEGLILLVPVVLLGVGGFALYNKTIDISDLLAFFLLLANFTGPIQKFMHSVMLFQDGTSGFIRFQEFMEITPSIQNKEDAYEITEITGNLRFESVDFKYDDGEENVINNMTFEVKSGEFVALVGASGVGKTTLTSLIPRFYDTTKGNIFIDNHDIRDLTLESLRSHIGMVQQDTYLFSGTIYDNIAYGDLNATRDDVINASIQANAHDFIMSLPKGYETDIGPRGVKLSGGQRQRLSIARAFLKNPEILIFDEATSSLDNESERVVQNAMEKLANNRTTIVIAHRLSTIKNAQRILVLNETGIAEEGTHDELIKNNGVYKELYEAQFKLKAV